MAKLISNIEELPPINRRIYDLIVDEYEGVISRFADDIGISQQRIDRLFKRDTRGKQTYPSVSEEIKKAVCNKFGCSETWLLLGIDDTFKDKSIQSKNVLSKSETVPVGANYRLVPIVHIDSVGGIRSNNMVSTTEPQYIEGYVPFVNAQEGDRAIFQSGNSMIPTIPPGSLMQIREVPNWREFFGYGNIFVIELKDGRRITKEVERYEENPKEYVWCKSHNPSVADEELPKNMIVSVWKVIKVLTDKGW